MQYVFNENAPTPLLDSCSGSLQPSFSGLCLPPKPKTVGCGRYWVVKELPLFVPGGASLLS